MGCVGGVVCNVILLSNPTKVEVGVTFWSQQLIFLKKEIISCLYAAGIFRQHAASIYGFVRFVLFVSFRLFRQKKFRPLLSKVGG